MKIKNETHWNTRDIRRLATRVAHVEKLTPTRIRQTTVYVKYRRHRRDSPPGYDSKDYPIGPDGKARISGHEIWLYVEKDDFNPVYWATVIAHEFAHNQGVRHRGMGHVYYKTDSWGWAADCPVRRKPEKPRPTLTDRRAKALAKVEAMLKVWERKRKLATTKVRKLSQKRTAIAKRLSEETPIAAMTSTESQANAEDRSLAVR